MRDGLDDLPQADPALRAALDRDIAAHGIQALHARLAVLDPITAARLKPADSQRIQRAMEIITLTGQPMSSLLARAPKIALPFTLLPIALEPCERSVLHQRIADRFDQMLQAQPGLLDEVRALRARGDLHAGLPSMRCVGYRQAWDYLEGSMDLATLREQGMAATRQLAKRQLTWLRSMPDRISVDCLAPDAADQVLQQVKAALVQAG